jgi:hypothetical protein
MEQAMLPFSGQDGHDPKGCAFIVDGPDGLRPCAAPRRPASSYCAPHHALCHITTGSVAEVNRLREVEALASIVGGRRARGRAGPSQRFLSRLEHVARAFS